MINLAKPNISTLTQDIAMTFAALSEAHAANEEPSVIYELIDALERLIDTAENLGYEINMTQDGESLRVELTRKKLN